MGKTPDQDQKPDTAAERRLRGEIAEERAAGEIRNPDTELRIDNEKDSLYEDDLEIDEGDDTLAGTRGSSSGIKP